jgi:hypothetical protein
MGGNHIGLSFGHGFGFINGDGITRWRDVSQWQPEPRPTLSAVTLISLGNTMVNFKLYRSTISINTRNLI